ncbi:uncharacterized protein MONBRDRAFT_25880 [Monosiga brevicollis MX1]|uniref:Uncharacterized protein n=1 Tax=Monosiga brevicollis TaxID=81824 RepID=A9V0R4_MONBE|nr:uncharacterized protein MONBRDRAFT_25880 [Monosiga brevicollis MX1]EDQ88800.1 predicted protein [Monosiga brevicollis MX1]|eukprot:XP_001746413.1 hypothetical protein [Monosiga brevicollis MX1]
MRGAARLPAVSTGLVAFGATRAEQAGVQQFRGMARYARVGARTGVMGEPAASSVTPSSANWVAGGLALAGVVGLGVVGAALASGTTAAGTVHDNSVWQPAVRQRISSTFTAFGAGVVFTGVATVALFRGGAHMLMMGRPILSLFVGVGSMFATSMLVHSLPAENTVAKYGALALFNTAVAFSLCPLMLLGGPLLLRAAAVTGGIVGSLSIVAANSPSDQFLWMAGPLAMGLGAVVVSSLGAAFLPSMRFAPMLHKVSLYGGLVVFSGFVLYDTSLIIENAKRKLKFDPVGESMRVYMDAINIFVRIAQIMAMNNNNRR